MFLPLLVFCWGLDILLRSTSWADVEYLHHSKVLKNRTIRPDAKRVISPFGSLYLHPSNPDCPTAANVPEETYVNPRCLRDSVSVSASNEPYHR